jgi:hypothetical protein
MWDGNAKHQPTTMKKPPGIFDTDYFPFIDDVLALIEMQSSEDMPLSAKRVAKLRYSWYKKLCQY